MWHFIRSLSLTVNYTREARHGGSQLVVSLLWTHVSLKMRQRHTWTDNPHSKWRRTPTLLCERLLKDAFVKTAERSAEVFEVREAELLVPQLGDRQTILRLRGRRGRRRWLLLLLLAQGLGWRLWVATHLQVKEGGFKSVRGTERWKKAKSVIGVSPNGAKAELPRCLEVWAAVRPHTHIYGCHAGIVAGARFTASNCDNCHKGK